MVLKSFEVSQERLSMNIDGTYATEGTDEGSEPIQHTPSKRIKLTTTTAETEEIARENDLVLHQQYVTGDPDDCHDTQCIIQAPKLSEIS